VNLLEQIDAGEIRLGGQLITGPGWMKTWSGATSASCSSRSTCSPHDGGAEHHARADEAGRM
jgi:hypothetical protein